MNSRDTDRLYQLPLSEFTKARDALAKEAPDGERAGIRRLQKPSLPAWAVNQLYWRDRATYQALANVGERRRASQLASLAGKSADLPRVDAAHARARKAAIERVREILKDAGEPASAATMTAVNETLDALPQPGAEAPGRLTRPLKPLGFEALTGLVKSGGKIRRPPAEVLPFRARAEPPKTSAAAERAAEAARRRAEAREKSEAEAKRKARAKIEAELRAAQSAERTLRKKIDAMQDQLTATQDALAEAAARRARLETRLRSV